MERKCKLLRYYGELKHIERQQPEAIISVKEVIARLHEIKVNFEAKQKDRLDGRSFNIKSIYKK